MRKRICYQKGNMYVLLCIPKPSTQIKKTSKVLSTQSQNILPGQWEIQSHQGKTAWEPDDLPSSSLLLFLFWKGKEVTMEKGRVKKWARVGTAWSTDVARPLAEGRTAGLLPLDCPGSQRHHWRWRFPPVNGEPLKTWKSVLSTGQRFFFSSLALLPFPSVSSELRAMSANLGRMAIFWACAGDVTSSEKRRDRDPAGEEPNSGPGWVKPFHIMCLMLTVIIW